MTRNELFKLLEMKVTQGDSNTGGTVLCVDKSR